MGETWHRGLETAIGPGSRLVADMRMTRHPRKMGQRTLVEDRKEGRKRLGPKSSPSLPLPRPVHPHHTMSSSSSSTDPTLLHLPSTLPYPITVVRLLVPPSSNPDHRLRHLRQKTSAISRTTPLFTYEYTTIINAGVSTADPKGKSREERILEVYESPVEGDLLEWLVDEGKGISDPRCVLFCCFRGAIS
jgi:hypothetical protein